MGSHGQKRAKAVVFVALWLLFAGLVEYGIVSIQLSLDATAARTHPLVSDSSLESFVMPDTRHSVVAVVNGGDQRAKVFANGVLVSTLEPRTSKRFYILQPITYIVSLEAESNQLIDSFELKGLEEYSDGLLIYNVGGYDNLDVEYPPKYWRQPGL